MSSKLLGTWKLSHCKSLDTDAVEIFDPFRDASGILSYDNQGMMSAQAMQSSHVNAISGNIFEASSEEFSKAFKNYIAYYGTYSINTEKNIVTHSIIGALWPNMIGLNVSRRFEFKDENTVVLSPVEPEAIANEKPMTRYLTWLRVT